jgi:hypothetical protein
MSEMEVLAYALFCAYLKYEGAADDCMPAWDEVVEYVRKGYLQEVEAAMAWLFEKGYLSRAGLQFIGRWEKHKSE